MIIPRVIDNRAVRSQLSPLLSPLFRHRFSAVSSVFNSPLHLTSNFHRRRASRRGIALKNVTNRRREGQKAATRPHGKPGVSTANGARLISWAIHLNDRAKASSSFHARVYTQRPRWPRACQQRVYSHTYCRGRAGRFWQRVNCSKTQCRCLLPWSAGTIRVHGVPLRRVAMPRVSAKEETPLISLSICKIRSRLRRGR